MRTNVFSNDRQNKRLACNPFIIWWLNCINENNRESHFEPCTRANTNVFIGVSVHCQDIILLSFCLPKYQTSWNFVIPFVIHIFLLTPSSLALDFYRWLSIWVLDGPNQGKQMRYRSHSDCSLTGFEHLKKPMWRMIFFLKLIECYVFRIVTELK